MQLYKVYFICKLLYMFRVVLWCNTAGRGLIGHQLATAWVKVLRLCFTDD